jgi:hypothetical protein
MITRAIGEYDVKQDARHEENSKKLDRNAAVVIVLKDTLQDQLNAIRTTLNEASGVKKLVAWAVPTIISLALLAKAAFEFFGVHH